MKIVLIARDHMYPAVPGPVAWVRCVADSLQIHGKPLQGQPSSSVSNCQGARNSSVIPQIRHGLHMPAGLWTGRQSAPLPEARGTCPAAKQEDLGTETLIQCEARSTRHRHGRVAGVSKSESRSDAGSQTLIFNRAFGKKKSATKTNTSNYYYGRTVRQRMLGASLDRP